MLGIINYAKKVYYTDRKAWDKMVVAAMEKDFSWNTAARTYEKLYDELLGSSQDNNADAEKEEKEAK